MTSVYTIERLPVYTRAGFDCRKDNANCPSCKILRMRDPNAFDDHGVFGGAAWFVVAVDLGVSGALRAALALEVLLCRYPSTVDRSSWGEALSFTSKPRGATLSFHRQVATGDPCTWLNPHVPAVGAIGCVDIASLSNDGIEIGPPCEHNVSFIEAGEIYGSLGNPDPDSDPSEQTEMFWNHLGRQLVEWIGDT